MKIPQKPPGFSDLLTQIDDDRFPEILRLGEALISGKYLHWDSLRHRQPPEGLTHEEWWLGVKYSRISAREEMPLLQKDGTPFHLVYVAPSRQRLHRIDQSFGMAGPSTSDMKKTVDTHGPKCLLANSLMEEAIRSSQLEGASTTRSNAKEMIRARRKPRDRSEQMILNNFMAMERIEELAEESLTPEAFFELHRILMEGTLDQPEKAGVFRTDEDDIVVGLLHSIDTAHVPPPAEELPARLKRVLSFANGDTPADWLHPVLRAVILHFMIGYDHPFVDGNGRTARALFYWCMVRYGYPLTKYLSISKILREAPARYARAYLHTENDDGDLTYFVVHQLEVIWRSIEGLEQYVERKAATAREIEEALKSTPGLNHRQLKLLGHAIRHPGHQYTVQSHRTSHRVATNTARSDLLSLAEKGLLIQTKLGRKFVFIAPRDLGSLVEQPDSE